MFNLQFNGVFELEYPNEFLEDLEELKKKHDVHFTGRIAVQDLGHYVDYQKIEDPVTVDPPVEEIPKNE